MHVTGIVQNNVLLSDSTTLPVSRAKKKVFLEALTDYIGVYTDEFRRTDGHSPDLYRPC